MLRWIEPFTIFGTSQNPLTLFLMMNRTLFAVVGAFVFLGATGQSGRVPVEVNYIKDIRAVPDMERQKELREGAGWRAFITEHPGWMVEFNEQSGMPRRAFGPPIPTNGGSAEERAMNFINAEFERFAVPIAELVAMSTAPTPKLTYVHMSQRHEGVSLLTSHVMVKLDAQNRVIAFGAEVFDAADLDMQPMLGEPAVADVARDGLTGIVNVEQVGLRILPIPDGRRMDLRLVREVTVHTNGRRPGRYQCLVDARTGELHYRRDLVVSEHDHGEGNDDDAADVQVNGTVHTDGALVPATVEGLPDLRVTINGNFLFADSDGNLPTGIAGPVSAQFQLRGRWSNVTTNNVNPSFTTTLNEGANTASFDNNANIKERTAYYSVSAIHNHCNAVLPGFTGMDLVLPTRVDLTTDTCNAFYDGSSINFYAQSATCRALSLYADVVYHEYGHGINDKFYQSQGSFFNNGAMGEGYADVWALTLTQNPVMTLGYRFGFPESNIRRYDINPQIYPINITGEVHQDGEIIAGAWWDTYRLLGWDMPLTLELFAAAYPGLQATAASGQEGTAYRNVLLDVLQADDDDSDLSNGTPNGNAIAEAFAIHGITLLGSAQFNHTPVPTSPAEVGIDLSASMALTFPFNTYLEGAELHYKVTNGSPWVTIPMNISGSNFTAQIPPQPSGTIVAYYLTVTDIYGALGAVSPSGAQFLGEGYLPHYILVDFDLMATEDGDDNTELGDWELGVPGDNATTGLWTYGVPIPSYITPGTASTIVQPGSNHTPGGFFCYFTGNASGPNAGLGENDVDAGKTTMQSDVIDLSGFENPAFTYWRWYSNNTGANPTTDFWQVSISNNGGSTWVPIENTKTSDRSWRRNAFRVQEYVVPTANMKLRFVASDSLRPGTELNGGSLVEGAIDDIQLWESVENTLSVPTAVAPIRSVFPNPANDALNLLAASDLRGLRMEVVDLTGRSVLIPAINKLVAGQLSRIDIRGLAEGQYILRWTWADGRDEQRFSVVR